MTILAALVMVTSRVDAKTITLPTIYNNNNNNNVIIEDFLAKADMVQIQEFPVPTALLLSWPGKTFSEEKEKKKH